MSARTASPTARLLRDSRFFSLPKPLPYPPPTSNADISPTAPTPYPIQQTIASPRSSRARGDWGLKRPLPLRSTNRSSNPTLRINAIDTIEHITDFDSASDHTLTLRKFGELNVPITTRSRKTVSTREAPIRSVFEGEVDRTAKTENGVQVPPAARWKFDGPWLAGMAHGEFLEYISDAVQPRRLEFLAFLRENHVQTLTRERDREARERRRDDAADDESSTTPTGQVEVSDSDFQSHLRTLRAPPFTLDSPLFQLIAQFLDLPGLAFPAPTTALSTPPSTSALLDAFTAVATSGEHAPPSTHRSAGLTYLRTDAYLQNHPILGPQAEKTPLQARVLKEANSVSGQTYKGHVGIAGFVATAPNNQRTPVALPTPEARKTSFDQARRDEQGNTVGLTVEGGNRIWVTPNSAGVDENGRVRVGVANADIASVNVRTGAVLEARDEGVKKVEGARGLDQSRGGRSPFGQMQMPQLDGSTSNAESKTNGSASARESEEERDFADHVQGLQQSGKTPSLDEMTNVRLGRRERR